MLSSQLTIAHIPGKNNTASDYLSRLEIIPKEKLILRIREDISTTPIELNVQSAGVTEEDQIFLFTDDDEETEEQIWKRKKGARSHPRNQLPDIFLEILSVHSSTSLQQTTLQRLSNITTMAIEQQNDVILHQLRLKLQKEDYSKRFYSRIHVTGTTPVNSTVCQCRKTSSSETIMTKQETYITARHFYQNT